MRRAIRLLSGAAIAVATLALAATAFADELKVGDQAPDFTLQGSDGKTHTLSQLKGKHVVLAWFPKAFTAG
jgi:thioredoxin-dependent peroxiredoxin